MGLQLIIGPSGSGKTTKLYRDLVEHAQMNETQMHFLIVPEQYTMQAQRDIVEYTPHHGTLNIDIVSFMRLAYRIFEELGTEVSTVLEDHGKSMLLRKVLGEVKDQLKLYHNLQDKPGFVDQVKSVISEFYQYEIHEEELKQMQDAVEQEHILSYKLSDLLVIYDAFQRALEGNYQVSEQMIDLLVEVAGESKLLRNAAFYLDGYTGFTPVQYRLLTKLMQVGDSVSVTITMDERSYHSKKKIKHLFALSKQTEDALMDCFSQCEQGEVTRTLLFDGEPIRFQNSPELYALEQNLYRSYISPYRGKVEHVHIAEASNIVSEIHGVAHTIVQYVRENQLRYKEIGVVVTSSEEYGLRCKEIFEQYEIPVFLDQSNESMNHPFVEALRAVLSIVSKGYMGYTYENMMRYMKTGLTALSNEELERLDNYLYVTSTVGATVWKRGFKKLPKKYWLKGNQKNRVEQLKKREEYMQEMNRLRIKVMEPIVALQSCFEKKSTVRERVIAIYQFMLDMNYEQQLNERAEEFYEREDYVSAKTWGKIYASFIELLDKCVDLLGEELLSNKELVGILDAGLEEMAIGMVPPTLDQVIIGDLTRTRFHNIKILFVLGSNDGAIPSKHTSPNLLSDADRKLLENGPVSLAPDSVSAAYQEQFYLYMLLTKPSIHLHLSYAKTNGSYSAVRPSSLLNQVRRILPELQFDCYETESYLDTISTVTDVLFHQLQEYFRIGTVTEELLASLAFVKVHEPDTYKRLRQSIVETNREEFLSKQLAGELYGEALTLSVTRLETFASCAFSHFLQYGLHLQERKADQFESLDFGNVLHKVAELFHSSIRKENIDYTTLTTEEIYDRTLDCVNLALEAEGYTFEEESARSKYVVHTIERMAKRTMKVLCRQIKLGDFRPESCELSFGPSGKIEGPLYELEDGGSVQLKGVIDRLDTCTDELDGEHHIYLRVLDYKTGNQTFDVTKLYYGLQLQLMTYLLVAKQKYPFEGEKIAAAALYYHIQDPIEESAYSSYGVEKETLEHYELLVDAQMRSKFKMNGIINQDTTSLSHMEHYDGEGYKFESIPVSYNKDGSLSKSSKCNSTLEMNRMLSFTENKIKELAGDMLKGEIETNPYIYKTEHSCNYCPYKSICLVDYKKSEMTRKLKKQELIAITGGEEGA